jgi:hypothetical protein
LTVWTARLGVILALVGVPAAAVDIDGLYKLSHDADCSTLGAQTGVLKIENRIFYGAEGQCRMTNPVNVRDMDAQLFDMSCSGEGTKWVERAMVMPAVDGGLILVWNGYAFQYERCPLPDETVTTD